MSATTLSREELQQEALSRAQGGMSMANYVPIFEGFTAKGIPFDEIIPRVNVFTYHAWRAKGRQVRKGEKGVRVTTWITPKGKDDAPAKESDKKERGKIAWGATVFHVSQTDPIN